MPGLLLRRNRAVRVAFALLVLLTPAARAGSQPEARSLAPLDVEWVRSAYGQEALFRLRLGVEAARDDGTPCPAAWPLWRGSAQEGLLRQQLRDGRPYAAGLILGVWQLRQQRCAGGNVSGGSGMDAVASPGPP